MLSQEDIDTLLACPKKIMEPRQYRLTVKRGHQRQEIYLRSKNNQHTFRVFIRQNEDFEENFSVGIAYHHPETGREYTLLRCNGPHGRLPVSGHYIQFHVHKTTADTIEKGLKEESFVVPTEKYSSLKEALLYFFKECNIMEAEAFFPAKFNEVNIFDLMGDQGND